LRLTIYNDSSLNAFSLPGQHITFSSGLIHAVETPEELAGVLAHEIQHVLHRDVMQVLVRGMLFTFVSTFVAGDVTGVVVIDPTLLWQLAHLRHSRDVETRSDQDAYQLLIHSHIDTSGFSRFFERLNQEQAKGNQLEDSIPEWLSTHPATESRKQPIIPAPVGATQIISEEDWQLLKQSCPAP